MKIATHPTDSLREHALLAGIPRWPDASPEMLALAEDISDRGIDQPLIVTTRDADGSASAGELFLVDGRHRLRAALLAGLDKVPVVVRDDADPVALVISSLVQRRHLTKGAQAYLCYPVVATAAERGVSARTQHLKAGQNPRKSIESTASPYVDDACARCGFGRDLYFQAKKLHEVFARRPDLREHFEPRILAGEVGLGAAIAGCAGQEATKGKGREVQPPEQLLFAAFDSVSVRFRSWDSLEGSARRAVTDRAIETVLALPEAVQESIARALRAQKRSAA